MVSKRLMATLSQLQTWLTDAQNAYHALVTGKAVVEFRDQSGEVVRYNQTDKPTLRNYISDLSAQIDALQGTCHSTAPLRVIF